MLNPSNSNTCAGYQMAGITDLNILIKNMKPKLDDREFVFCTVSERQLASIEPLLTYREEEGITVIIERKTADHHGFPYSGSWALITLSVQSGLTAVGFLAAITKALAEAGISANVVSAYYHDHLFVPRDKADAAMKVLQALSLQVLK